MRQLRIVATWFASLGLVAGTVFGQVPNTQQNSSHNQESESELLPEPVRPNEQFQPSFEQVELQYEAAELANSDYEVMMRGPVHEAFAEQFSVDPQASLIIDKTPPEPIDEQSAEYRPDGENIVWIPGYWGWDVQQNDFIWVTGLWRNVPDGRRWVPGYWTQVDQGYQWVSGFWMDAQVEQIVYLPAPPASIDNGPSVPAPADDYFWVPGCWVYQTGSYRWYSGYWEQSRTDLIWVPDRYVSTPSGFIYRAGYWDHGLSQRGTIFCPVQFARPYQRLSYTPRYIVPVGTNWLANLFLYPRYNHYYFGNYYGYSNLGQNFYPWVTSYRSAGIYDPIFGYYAYQNRNRSFVRQVATINQYYLGNQNARPATTALAQLQMLSNPTIRGNVGTSIARNATEMGVGSLQPRPLSIRQLASLAGDGELNALPFQFKQTDIRQRSEIAAAMQVDREALSARRRVEAENVSDSDRRRAAVFAESGNAGYGQTTVAPKRVRVAASNEDRSVGGRGRITFNAVEDINNQNEPNDIDLSSRRGRSGSVTQDNRNARSGRSPATEDASSDNERQDRRSVAKIPVPAADGTNPEQATNGTQNRRRNPLDDVLGDGPIGSDALGGVPENRGPGNGASGNRGLGDNAGTTEASRGLNSATNGRGDESSDQNSTGNAAARNRDRFNPGQGVDPNVRIPNVGTPDNDRLRNERGRERSNAIENAKGNATGDATPNASKPNLRPNRRPSNTQPSNTQPLNTQPSTGNSSTDRPSSRRPFDPPPTNRQPMNLPQGNRAITGDQSNDRRPLGLPLNSGQPANRLPGINQPGSGPQQVTPNRARLPQRSQQQPSLGTPLQSGATQSNSQSNAIPSNAPRGSGIGRRSATISGFSPNPNVDPSAPDVRSATANGQASSFGGRTDPNRNAFPRSAASGGMLGPANNPANVRNAPGASNRSINAENASSGRGSSGRAFGSNRNNNDRK